MKIAIYIKLHSLTKNQVIPSVSLQILWIWKLDVCLVLTCFINYE